VTFLVKKSWATFVLATTLFGLTGCADNNNATDNNLGRNVRNNTDNGVTTRNVRNNTNNNALNVRNVSNQDLRVSNRAGRNVEKLKQVDMAHVIIRNNDAYVGVRLNNQGATGTNNNGGNRTNTGTTNITGTGTNARNNNNNARGTGTGMIGNNTGTTGITGTGMGGNNAGTTGITGTGNTGTALTPGTTGTRDTGLNGGTNGNRGNGTSITGTLSNDTNNGTNGAGATGYKRVSTALDQKIADQVRKTDKNIHNVYVSYDTNFFNQMGNYSNDIRTGRNRDGIWDDFTDTVRRIFR
jgi:hypothetical protein